MIVKTVPPVVKPPETVESITLNEAEARAVFSLIGNTSVYAREQLGLTHENSELLGDMYGKMSTHHLNFLWTCDKKAKAK